jgi:hypothetical protein
VATKNAVLKDVALPEDGILNINIAVTTCNYQKTVKKNKRLRNTSNISVTNITVKRMKDYRRGIVLILGFSELLQNVTRYKDCVHCSTKFIINYNTYYVFKVCCFFTNRCLVTSSNVVPRSSCLTTGLYRNILSFFVRIPFYLQAVQIL